MFTGSSRQHHTWPLVGALLVSFVSAGATLGMAGAAPPVMTANANSNSYVTCVPSVDNAPSTDSADKSLPTNQSVSCAISMLSHREKSDAFGRRVADSYVVLQVQVSTDDSEYSFHLHDVTLAKGDSGEEVARDKRIVTAVSQEGQLLTRRNLIARSLDGISTIAGGLTPFGFFTSSFKSAVALFQGPLINSYKSTFPDFTVNQVALLNDKSLGVQSDVISQNAPSTMILFFTRDNFAEIAGSVGKIKGQEYTNLEGKKEKAEKIKLKNVDANFFALHHIKLEVHVHTGYFKEPPTTKSSSQSNSPATPSAPSASNPSADASPAKK